MGIHSVLEDVMAAAVSEKAKGEALERLIKVYLSQDQAWTGRFDAVWLWDEWPGRDGKPYTGIDLVARERDTGNLWAIQSKFYAPEHTLQKSDIDSCYLHILDAYLDDLVLDAVERQGLDDLAALDGIDDERRAGLHNACVAALVMAARRDGIVSEAEHELIESVCRALDASPDLIPEVTARPSVSALDGQRVCFTGTFVVAGIQMSKEQLAGIAANAGLQPVDDVRKAGCDLLVAADPASTSGKATKARQWGIPVIGISDFMALVDSANI